MLLARNETGNCEANSISFRAEADLVQPQIGLGWADPDRLILMNTPQEQYYAKNKTFPAFKLKDSPSIQTQRVLEISLSLADHPRLRVGLFVVQGAHAAAPVVDAVGRRKEHSISVDYRLNRIY